MVLKIRHRSFHYKKFQLDIWGILITNWNYQGRPQQPQLSIYLRELGGLMIRKSVEWNKSRRDVVKFLKEQVVNKINSKIKPSSMKEISAPWKARSRKLSKLLEMFYHIYRSRRSGRRSRRKRYVYRLNIIRREKRRKRMKARFISLRLVKLFYITYSYRQFRQLARAMRSKDGAFEQNYLLALEGRLLSYLYRTSLLTNPFQTMDFIKKGHVLVAARCENHYNYRVPLNTMVTFSSWGKRLLYMNILARLAKKRTFFNVPKYMYLSYLFLYSYMTRPPQQYDLVFPVSIDVYRATGYAF